MSSVVNFNYTPLIKKFQEFIHKIKNTNVLIKIDIVPFKVLPIDFNALTLDPILETFFILGFRYHYQEPFSIFTILKMKSPLHQRACIKFCGFNDGKNVEEVSRKQTFVCGSSFREFFEDYDRNGRPSTSKTDENVDKIKEIMAENHKLTIRQLAASLNIAYESVQDMWDVCVKQLAKKRSNL